jgi:predicted metal-dependent hydrolase
MLKSEFIYNYENTPFRVMFYLRREMVRMTFTLKGDVIIIKSPRAYAKEVIINMLSKVITKLINNSNDYFTLWGERMELVFKQGKPFSYFVDPERKMIIITSPKMDDVSREKYVKELLLDQVSRYIESNTSTYEYVLNHHNIAYIKPIVKHLKSVHGYYKPKNSCIAIASHMAFLKPQLLDLVLYHEHIHTLVFNHGIEFHQLLESIVPNHRSLQTFLNKQKFGYFLKK